MFQRFGCCFILRLVSDNDRVNRVFHLYFDWGLKEATRINRGIRTRFKITEL